MSLSEQAIRLMRTKWPNANMLAEEMFLILLQDQDPTTGPINVDPSPDQTGPVIPMNPIDFPQFIFPDLELPDLGTNPFGFDITEGPPDDQGAVRREKTQDYWIRLALPGKVVSGSGANYFMNLYPNGTTEQAATNKSASKISDVLADLDRPLDPAGFAVTNLTPENGDLAVGTWVIPVYRVTHVEVTELGFVKMPENKFTSVETKIKILSRTHEMAPGTGGGGATFPGIVTGGSGDTYTMNIYTNGVPLLIGAPTDAEASMTPTSVTVRQMQINSAASIPVGTWAMVSKVGTSYFMQVPVWLTLPS